LERDVPRLREDEARDTDEHGIARHLRHPDRPGAQLTQPARKLPPPLGI
jgi:hypothetical protein